MKPAQTIEEKLQVVPHIDIKVGLFSMAINTLGGLLFGLFFMASLLTFGVIYLLN